MESSHFSVKAQVVGGAGEIMVGHEWLWVAATKSWLVVGGGDRIMAGRGWS